MLETGLIPPTPNLSQPIANLILSALARDLTIEAAQSASAVRGLRGNGPSARPLPMAQLKKLLDSRNDRDILEGLRRVISVGSPLITSFPIFLLFTYITIVDRKREADS